MLYPLLNFRKRGERGALVFTWKWSGRMDLNHRPPGPEEESQKFISAASGVAYGIADHLFPLLNWTDVGPKFFVHSYIVGTVAGRRRNSVLMSPPEWVLILQVLASSQRNFSVFRTSQACWPFFD